MQKAILRTNEVCDLVGVGRPTLWRWRKAGTFPAPVRLGPRAVGWRAEDVQAWIDARPLVE